MAYQGRYEIDSSQVFLLWTVHCIFVFSGSLTWTLRSGALILHRLQDLLDTCKICLELKRKLNLAGTSCFHAC